MLLRLLHIVSYPRTQPEKEVARNTKEPILSLLNEKSASPKSMSDNPESSEPNRIELSDNSNSAPPAEPETADMAEAQGTTEKETQEMKGGAPTGEEQQAEGGSEEKGKCRIFTAV